MVLGNVPISWSWRDALYYWLQSTQHFPQSRSSVVKVSTWKRFSTKCAFFLTNYLFRVYILVLCWTLFILVTLFCSFRRRRFTIFEPQHHCVLTGALALRTIFGFILFSLFNFLFPLFCILCTVFHWLFSGGSPFLFLMDPMFCPCMYQPYL